MAIFELNKTMNQIYRNVVNGFDAVDPDYFLLNPFGPNGELSLNEMNVVIDLRESWNKIPFIILLPEIKQLPSLNFNVKVTAFIPPGVVEKAVFAAVGNLNDNYDSNNTLLPSGTLEVRPISIEPFTQDYGWWLITNGNTAPLPAVAAQNEVTTLSAPNETPNLEGSEAFKQFLSTLKK